MTLADDHLLLFALDRGLVTREQIDEAQRGHTTATSQTEILHRLVTQGVLDAPRLARLLAEAAAVPLLELNGEHGSDEVLDILPRPIAVRHQVMPVAVQEDGALLVALADPLDIGLIDNLSHLTGRRIEPGVATAEDIRRALARHFGRQAEAGADFLDNLETPGLARCLGDTMTEQMNTGDAPIIKMVHSIIQDAVARRASDIHFEPLEKRFRIRYRIDGVLLEVSSPPKQLQPAVISRLKIMADISIAEKRVPQDGRIRLVCDGRDLDLRVATLPTAHGESVVIRILDRQGMLLGLPELGLRPDDQRQLERLIAAPDGLVLVTGPTGSGKTTTLYACLQHLNQTDRKIITVEDPVEYQLAGINQVPVRPAVGMTFAAALRAMLRQSPNIVMVGEIRDRETAEIALNASLTGHMVFSTLHTNDAPGAVTRLLDIGARPFLVAAALRATVAQRLVRRICPHCRRAYAPSAGERHALGLTGAQAAGAEFSHGIGCAACFGTGYLGRTAIYEIFLVNDGIRAMLGANPSAARLRTRARQDGIHTMRADGIRKILAGLTTIEEVLSITVADSD